MERGRPRPPTQTDVGGRARSDAGVRSRRGNSLPRRSGADARRQLPAARRPSTSRHRAPQGRSGSAGEGARAPTEPRRLFNVGSGSGERKPVIAETKPPSISSDSSDSSDSSADRRPPPTDDAGASRSSTSTDAGHAVGAAWSAGALARQHRPTRAGAREATLENGTAVEDGTAVGTPHRVGAVSTRVDNSPPRAAAQPPDKARLKVGPVRRARAPALRPRRVASSTSVRGRGSGSR
jgi:hypothetical protein